MSSLVKQYPVEDFFKNPEKSSYQLSPNGTYISYMAPYENRMNVFVRKFGSDEEGKRITDVTDRDIAGFAWANDDRILYLKDEGGDENYALFAVNLDGTDFVPLTNFPEVKTQFIDPLEEDDDHVLIALNKRVSQVFDPYRLNINTGKLEILAENPGNISAWMTDHETKLRIAITTDGVNTSLLHRANEEADWNTIITTNFKESLSPLFFTFDNKNLYAASNIGRDKSSIVEYDIDKGKEIRTLFAHEEVDVSNLSYSRKRKVLTGISYTTDKRHRKFLDAHSKAIFKDLEGQLPGYEVTVSSSNKNEDKLVVRTFSDRSLGAFYFYDVGTKKLDLIDEVSPWLAEDHLCEMKPFQYESRDGLTIYGYLTLPKISSGNNVPLVINPHGGPWVRDGWGFNPEVQFLANRGYAVAQVNYRGSVGYGRAFWEASFKEWGKKMQDDITDGVQWLIKEGIADPKRVAIYGGSYGGYATLAGLTFTSDLYACGVDYVGVSNLFTFMETIPPYWEQFLDMMYEMVGHPENDKELLAAASPALHAENITAPLLIAQGAKDPRVNVEESNQMVDAMKARGVDVEYMVEAEEGHGFRNEENRFKFYRAMEKFLKAHLS